METLSEQSQARVWKCSGNAGWIFMVACLGSREMNSGVEMSLRISSRTALWRREPAFYLSSTSVRSVPQLPLRAKQATASTFITNEKPRIRKWTIQDLPGARVRPGAWVFRFLATAFQPDTLHSPGRHPLWGGPSSVKAGLLFL